MTDRIKGLTVVLDKDYREDDIQALVDAISLMRGVAIVDTHVTVPEDHFIMMRTRQEIRKELLETIDMYGTKNGVQS